MDTGDFVIVVNAEKVTLGGKKETDKVYTSFSGFVGGHKSENVKSRRARHPEKLVELAVRGMIPHNRLGRSVYTKLKVYTGDRASARGAAARGDGPLIPFHSSLSWLKLPKPLSPPAAARRLSRVFA